MNYSPNIYTINEGTIFEYVVLCLYRKLKRNIKAKSKEMCHNFIPALTFSIATCMLKNAISQGILRGIIESQLIGMAYHCYSAFESRN